MPVNKEESGQRASFNVLTNDKKERSKLSSHVHLLITSTVHVVTDMIVVLSKYESQTWFKMVPRSVDTAVVSGIS